MTVTAEEPFSDQLEAWLLSDSPKTIGDLGDVFAEKSFAVTIMFLMFLPALPLPTGGITHVFEAITVLLAAQMVLGLREIWLPKAWRRRPLGDTMTTKALPFIVRRIRWFEKFSKPRGALLLERRWFVRVLGLLLMAFAVAAGFAPPFTGLDTLPAMGAVAVAIGIILEDLVVVGIGAAIGAGGVTLTVTVGAAIVGLVKGLLP